MPKFLRIAERWYVKTPDRALESAYQSALKIQAIEERHFQGKVVAAENAVSNYSDRVVEYFQSEVDQELKNIEIRLVEFETARPVIRNSTRSSHNLSGAASNVDENASIRIEKLNFVDAAIARYKGRKKGRVTVVPPTPDLVAGSDLTSSKIVRSVPANNASVRPKPGEAERASAKRGAVPRSILRTLDKIKREIDPEEGQEAEAEMVIAYRQSRDKTFRSVRFVLFLIVVPLLVFNIAKLVLIPQVEMNFFTPETDSVFFSEVLEEEALSELSKFEEDLHFRQVLGMTPHLGKEEVEEQVREKAHEIAEEYRLRSSNAVSNWAADILSLIAFGVVAFIRREDFAVFKSFIDEVVYGLSDSAKAFLIILLTDMFVGFHSPHGWEIILEGIARHFGLPESRDFNFLFIATFPVILDTVLKYWIFRYLNRISPSAVATYRNMNE
ncbi:MAG: proton extrusion protein PcxA [Cyanobacteria bacterium J06641_5]